MPVLPPPHAPTHKHPRIPEPLRPYIRLPRRDSLTLVTGVLGATTNWIVLRFIGAAAAAAAAAAASSAAHGSLRNSKQKTKEVVVGENGGEGGGLNGDGEDSTGQAQGQGEKQDAVAVTVTVAVVLVSWMRDLEFWRTEGMKVAGIDIARLAEQGRFAFVDGLKELFSGSEGSEHGSNAKTTSGTLSSASVTTPARALPLPDRGSTRSQLEQNSIPIISQSRPLAASTEDNQEHHNSSNSPATVPFTPTNRSKNIATHFLKSPTLPHLEETISQAIASLAQPNNVLLILDNPDLFLAATSTSTSAISLTNTIQKLRSHAETKTKTKIHSTIVTLAADGPLLFPADQPSSAQSFTGSGTSTTSASPSSIQSHHAALVTGLAHRASSILSVRLLDTGFAGDVSGVLRVGLGGSGGATRADGRLDRSADMDEDEDEDSADGCDEHDEEEKEEEEEIESGLTKTGREMLYFIGTGGDVKILT